MLPQRQQMCQHLARTGLGNQSWPKPCAGTVSLGLPVSRKNVHGDAEEYLRAGRQAGLSTEQ